MRVLVYPHDLNMGGSQTNAIDLAAAVTGLGHECVLFGRPGTLCDRIERLGLEFVASPDPGRRPSARIARAIRELARERRIDIVHGYEWPPGLEAAVATETLPDAAAVCTVMSMAVAPFLPRWMPLVVGTQQISAVEQAAGRTNVTLIEPPVDLGYNAAVDPADVAAFRHAYGLGDFPVVVIVSRLVADLKAEGILTAVKAAGAMAGTSPFDLVIVGDGKARPSIEALAAEANRAAGRRVVVLTGELSDPRPAYAAADVVIGMGGSALRSLAFGKPLIVQGERGYFRTLTPATVDEFRWQGWYGIGSDPAAGPALLAAALTPLLADPALRAELGAFGRAVVAEFSLERAAERQLTVYHDAFATRADQKRRLVAAGHSVSGLAGYYLDQRLSRIRGRQRTDDFNAQPSTVTPPRVVPAGATGRKDGPILYFPGVGWDTMAGTDRHLVEELAQHTDVVWVDTPHSVLRRRDRVLPAVSHPLPHVVRLRASTLVGVQRPLLRGLANRRRAQVARHYLREHHLTPRAVIASTTAPMLPLTRDLGGRRMYFATDDFVEAAGMWGVSREYLSRSRERNLDAADVVVAVTDDLARHLQRGPRGPHVLPNGVELERFRDLDALVPEDVPLPPPIAGVVGQFNARTDLDMLQAVHDAGTSLLLVGPRWFTSDADNAAFDRLVGLPGVHWTGALPRERLPALLRVVDVGLTPYRDSMFNRRSFPLKTLEYLAAGVPVVTTAVAAPTGVDDRHVTAADSPDVFARVAGEVARTRRHPADIRRGVDGSGWDGRAAAVLGWLFGDSE